MKKIYNSMAIVNCVCVCVCVCARARAFLYEDIVFTYLCSIEQIPSRREQTSRIS